MPTWTACRAKSACGSSTRATLSPTTADATALNPSLIGIAPHAQRPDGHHSRTNSMPPCGAFRRRSKTRASGTPPGSLSSSWAVTRPTASARTAYVEAGLGNTRQPRIAAKVRLRRLHDAFLPRLAGSQQDAVPARPPGAVCREHEPDLYPARRCLWPRSKTTPMPTRRHCLRQSAREVNTKLTGLCPAARDAHAARRARGSSSAFSAWRCSACGGWRGRVLDAGARPAARRAAVFHARPPGMTAARAHARLAVHAACRAVDLVLGVLSAGARPGDGLSGLPHCWAARTLSAWTTSLTCFHQPSFWYRRAQLVPVHALQSDSGLFSADLSGAGPVRDPARADCCFGRCIICRRSTAPLTITLHVEML